MSNGIYTTISINNNNIDGNNENTYTDNNTYNDNTNTEMIVLTQLH